MRNQGAFSSFPSSSSSITFPSSFSSSYAWKYDVFLSFRGEDTRKNFTDHLYAILNLKGIITYRDDKRLERGKFIAPELMKAIEESLFSIVIFSRNYASSTWCLDELVKIVECMNEKGLVIMPVFYHVDSSDVRKQTGSFQEAFTNHEEAYRENPKKVQRWRTALTQVANISGWDLKDRHESEVIGDIVKEIFSKLPPTSLSVEQDLVGIDSRFKKLSWYIGTGLDVVRMIGICGMGGIGKTTIARVVHDRMSRTFEGSSFLANVREVSERVDGLIGLQEQLLSQILNERDIKVWDVGCGIDMISSRLRNRRVLVIIDDVDDLKQLKALAGKHDWFGLGSRIIITTRDKHLLNEVDEVYEAEGLIDNEALQLFTLKAFKNNHCPEDYLKLSKHFIKYAAGHPLALQVLGSFLFKKEIHEWGSALDRLKQYPEKKIFDVLQISFDGLAETEKKIFLDIACFFKGENKDCVTQILDSCGFFPDIGIKVLIDKSLITISNNSKLWMHDLLQEMGWKIVNQESLEEPGKRSRLWNHEDIYRVLTKNTGTEAVEGIVLDSRTQKELHVSAKAFSKMNKLRLLQICNVQLPNGLEYLSSELRLLKWHGYPLKYFPSSFKPDKLFELDMPGSRIEQLWKKNKQHFHNLKSINLSYCKNLIRIPDLTVVPNLGVLNLEHCTNLAEVHPSVGLHKRLKSLLLGGCKCLSSLPSYIEMVSLHELNLNGCLKLKKFPEIVGNMECLKYVTLHETAIEELPLSVEHLTGLEDLYMDKCKNLVSLPRSICGLKSLMYLSLSGCSKLQYVPESLGDIECLEHLDLSGTAITQPPSSVFLLKNLEELSFCGCKGPPSKSWLLPFGLMQRKNPDPMALMLPDSFAGLCTSLTSLDLSDCNLSEGAIPNDIGCLSSLTVLDLSGNNFVSLPASINQLLKLRDLMLENCRRVRSMPELPVNIVNVRAKDCASLQIFSDPLNLLSSLEMFSHPHDFKGPMLHCINCFKLVDKQGCNSMAFPFIGRRYLQVLFNRRRRFEIVVPGSEISEWFDHQSEGTSVFMQWSPHLHNNAIFVGFALSAVVIIPKHAGDRFVGCGYGLKCALIVDGYLHLELYGFLNGQDGPMESDHLWLIFVGRDELEDDFLTKPCHIEISFDPIGPELKVKKCGVRPVYWQEVEDFNQTTNKLSSSIVESFNEEHPHPKRLKTQNNF